ncbi:MAG: recombinase family protein [Coleofasciculaceae cyanobacterium]
MPLTSLWITGSTGSGKTTRLVTQFSQWVESGLESLNQKNSAIYSLPKRDRRKSSAILVLAANDDNRRNLADLLITAIGGRYPVLAKTPLGFFQDEVTLFWPLLIQTLNLKAQFPLRLRPETEQELATKFWQAELAQLALQLPGANNYTKVRRLLDLLQLAALSGTPVEDISSMLCDGLVEQEVTPDVWESVGKMLLEWRRWCLERGLLSYGIIGEFYWRYLLPNSTYQRHLRQRYQAVLADDVDDYPAIARDLFECLLDQGAVGAFTYNQDGQARLGLNADPNYLEGLAGRCQIETLPGSVTPSLADKLSSPVLEIVTSGLGETPNEAMFTFSPGDSLFSLQTTSRAQLLQQTAQVIIDNVKSGQVQPRDIVLIAPGLDAIARYTLTDILTSQGIAVEPLNDQRPLNNSPMIRALLTMLALVYPGLGRLVDKDAIAEMLVVLSGQQELLTEHKGEPEPPLPRIDPVRAGLIADYCYAPDPEQPRLLPVESFQRWDRLGYCATTAYQEIVQWLELQREQQQQRLIPSIVSFLDRAIQKFLWNGSNLPYDQLAALRELMETAQHYWEVDRRLRQTPVVESGEGLQENTTSLPNSIKNLPGDVQESSLEYPILNQRRDAPAHTTIAQFIQMLRRGTVTANPYPVRPLAAANAVTLATIFQYRAARTYHRWQFWLDAGSQLWLSGGAANLFGAFLFLREWSGRPWTEEEQIKVDEQRLERIIRDLLGRVSERVYLCHSDLAVNGAEQNGPLLSLVNAAVSLELSSRF